MNERVPGLELLEVAMSAEFNECSAAGAELSSAVKAELQDKSAEEKTLYALGETAANGHNCIIKWLPTYLKRASDGDTPEDDFQLALVKQVTTIPAEPTTGRRGVFRRAIKDVVQTVEGTPQLVAVLNQGDSYIPLATFSRRQDGHCSWVQIGSEMRDDNFYVTTSDERGSRLQVIEEMRHAVSNLKAPSTYPALLTNLLNNELVGREGQLDEAKEQQLVRRTYEQLGPEDKLNHQNLYIFTKEWEGAPGSFARQSVMVKNLLPGIISESGRVVNLTLAKGESENIQLLAITRGEIALPLANFNKTEGTVSLHSALDNISLAKRRKVMDSLHNLIVNPKSSSMLDYRVVFTDTYGAHRVDSTSTSSGTVQGLAMARVLHERGLIDLVEERDDYTKKYYSPHSDDMDQARLALDNFLRNPVGTPFYDSEAFMKARSHMRSRAATEGPHLCELLDIPAYLKSVVGPTTPAEERLASKLWDMSRRSSYTRDVPDMRLGNSTAEVRLHALLSHQLPAYDLTIQGVQKALMAEEAPKTLLKSHFNMAVPLFSSESCDDVEASRKATDVLEILNLF